MRYRDTRVEVDLSRIEQNMRVIRQAMGETDVLAVVKANAYGHGLIPVAHTALGAGAKWLGVAIPEEGEALRRSGVTAPILILGDVNARGMRAAIENGLTLTVFEPRAVEALSGLCHALNRTADVHIKLDTGMGRIGVRDEGELTRLLRALEGAKGVHLTGVFTHFADADGEDETFSLEQLARFERMSALLPKGILRHAAASAASLRYPKARFDMVRAGIILYGYPPAHTALDVKPALRWITSIAYIKEIEPGDTVSYGRTFTAARRTRVATLPVGYGDGYPRALSNRADVLVAGQRCPIIGRVCMDQTMIDVTDVLGAKAGDPAVLLGTEGGQTIDAEELARLTDTISYEILLSPSGRVPIEYVNIPRQ